jgi:hypothetical protein
MKMIVPLGMSALLFAVLTATPNFALAQGKTPKVDEATQKIYDKLLDAIKTGDRDAFVANAADKVKEGTTQEVMDALEKQLGGRLKKGYESTFLCQLKQSGHQVYLWKLTFKDEGDDLVVRVAIKDGKVGGFFFN